MDTEKNSSKPVNKDTKNPKNKKKTVSSIIFLACMTILVISLFFSVGEVKEIIDTLHNMTDFNNYKWLFVAIALAIGYFLLWPISLCIIAKANKAKSSFKDSFYIGCSEHFYNGITPFAAGGQPFQVYSYTKCGVDAGKATGIVLANFVSFMLSTNFIALIALCFWGQYNINAVDPSGAFQWIAICGYVINFLVLVFMFSLGVSKKIRNGIVGIAKWFCKFNWIGKHLSSKIHILEEYCDNAQIAFKQVEQNKKAFILAFLARTAALCCYYAIPYYVMRSLGIFIPAKDFILTFMGTSFAITAVVFVPTPGGTGGIEYAFSIVIASVAASSLAQAQAVSLIWRMLTFYLILIVSFIMGSIFEARVNKRMDQEIKEEQEKELVLENVSYCDAPNPLLDEQVEPKEAENIIEEPKSEDVKNDE